MMSKSAVGVKFARLSLLGLLSLGFATVSVAKPGEARLRRTDATFSGQTLAVALPALGKSVSEPLSCGPNAADRRIVLFARDRRFGEIMTQLTKFVPVAPGKAAWFPYGSGSIFDEDIASYRARLRAIAALEAKNAAEARKGLAELRNWTKPNSRDDRLLAKTKRRTAAFIAVFDGLARNTQNAALAGHSLFMRYGQLPAASQAAVRNIVGIRRLQNIQQVAVQVSTQGPCKSLTVWMTPSSGISLDDLTHIPKLTDPEEGYETTYLLRQYVVRQRGPKNKQTIADLQKPITLSQTSQPAYAIPTLQELSAISGLPVLGEYDACYTHPYNPPSRRALQNLDRRKIVSVPVWKALDLICERFDLTWDYKSGWIWIRSPRTVPSWAGHLQLEPTSNTVRSR